MKLAFYFTVEEPASARSVQFDGDCYLTASILGRSRWTCVSDGLILAGLLLGASLTAVLYSGMALRAAGEFGFPLDDAWIHQTYARNLARAGEWVFVSGQPSVGSTAPFWTMVLSTAFLLPGNPQLWTYALGVLFYAGSAWMGYRLSMALFRHAPPSGRFGDPATPRVGIPLWGMAWLTAAAILAEWHMAWASVSGMEIPLYTFLVLWIFTIYYEQKETLYPISLGALGGLLTLTRPEGLWLVALIIAHLLFTRRRAALSAVFWLGLTWALLIAPYVLYNWTISGRLLPNTFYAKQREYAILTEHLPVWYRLLREGWTPFIGAQVLMLPGIGWCLWTHIRRSDEERVPLLPLIWAAGLIVVYALRLPVTYQHGRYMMPIIPILLIYSIGGLYDLLGIIKGIPPLLARAWVFSVVVLFAVFWARGAVAYAEDTATITCEMVETARWLADNTAPDAVIAAHDIGAIGFFAERKIVDLAGLVSPTAIPIIRNEPALADLIRSRQAAYLVTFPDWYPLLTGEDALTQDPWLEPVTQRHCATTGEHQRPGMTVFRVTT